MKEDKKTEGTKHFNFCAKKKDGTKVVVTFGAFLCNTLQYLDI
ncbi:hypothetical protein EV213_1349 [Aureibacillus halotolerans]|uniref:Uncharacterized protein n=1 Tax=Aureibacillus halotolerans TaxID=1508390 RepID=A0A4R6TP06_9BACI|nr:hypothetical protein EV213_1349 [Aureibacillus halotolerans]